MIHTFSIQSLGPISSLVSKKVGKINLLIGHNGVGKTFALKVLYASIKSVEQYKRGKEPRSQKDILFDNLYWTFQSESLGNIVRKGDKELTVVIQSHNGETLDYSFGSSTVSEIKNVHSTFSPTEVNSVFMPAKEVVSLGDAIERLYELDKLFGFDKTYVDLERAMSKTVKGRNYKEFSEARKLLNNELGGKLEYDGSKKVWLFRDKDKKVFDLNLMSEGIKRLSILELLLGNHYLSADSVVFIDEAEANLHPALVEKFMEVIVMMTKAGVQFFISTHSYFVIKNLYIMSQQEKISMPTFSFEKEVVNQYDLLDGMPHNPIIQESINVYRREIDL